jgi:hypothetical protein
VLKLCGYLVSCLSVLCLGVVSWSGAAEKPLMLALLIVGMATSVVGMMIRFWSYLRDKREQAAQTRISK